MTTVIRGGTSGVDMDVDATSKAGRGTLYDSEGTEISHPPEGAFSANIDTRIAAADAVGSVHWAARNAASSDTIVYVTRIYILVGCDTPPGGAGAPAWNIERFDTATPTGGTTITAAKKRSGYGAPNGFTDIRQHTAALTVTSVNFTGEFYSAIRYPVNTAANNPGFPPGGMILDWSANPLKPRTRIELIEGEGICIRVAVVMVAGMLLSGYIEWEEEDKP